MKRGWTGQELLNSEFPEPPVLIQGLVWKNDNIIILGDAKTGKSLLSLQMLCNLTTGEPFLDEFPVIEKCNVLMTQAEGKMYESASRYKKMAEEIKSDPKRLRWLYLPAIPMDRSHSAEEFVATIKKEFGDWTPDVIFFDPLYKLRSRGSLKDDDVAGDITNSLDHIKLHYDATVIINHHEHRAKHDEKGARIHEGDASIFGSFVWRAWPDHVIHFIKDSKTTRKLSCGTQRSGAVVEEIKLYFNQPNPLYYETLEDTSESEHLIHKYVENKKKVHVTEVATGIKELWGFDYANSTIHKALRKLVRDKKIKKLVERGCYGIIVKEDTR